MTIKIISNGSGFVGPLSILEERLRTEVLDPTFERYGNFVYPCERRKGWTKIWGNFETVSHVFDIATDEPAVVARLRKAIRKNQATPAYKVAKAAMRKREAEARKRRAHARKEADE